MDHLGFVLTKIGSRFRRAAGLRKSLKLPPLGPIATIYAHHFCH